MSYYSLHSNLLGIMFLFVCMIVRGLYVAHVKTKLQKFQDRMFSLLFLQFQLSINLHNSVLCVSDPLWYTGLWFAGPLKSVCMWCCEHTKAASSLMKILSRCRISTTCLPPHQMAATRVTAETPCTLIWAPWIQRRM